MIVGILGIVFIARLAMMIEMDVMLDQELLKFLKVAITGVTITEFKGIAFIQSCSNLILRGGAIIVTIQGEA